MQIHSHHFATLAALIGLTTVSGMLLNITSPTNASTESVSASVEVSSACTMSNYVIEDHSISLTVGSSEDNIGTTELTTICNDPGGYAIYAVGFTNDTVGNTNLTGLESGINILTGTSSGNVSNWSMKVTKDTSSYNYSNIILENGYNNYKEVPTEFIKVASFPTNTDTSTGSTILTSYAVNVSTTQAADTYAGQVKYIIVHPSTASAPYYTGLYMQEVTNDTITDLGDGDMLNVRDYRTGEDYIATVIDINGVKTLWMNNDLKLPAGTTLTSADSNVVSNFTLSSEQWVSSLSGGNYCKQLMALSNEVYYTNGTYYYNWYAATANPTDEVANPSNEYCATPARDENSLGDICPKGWRLPVADELYALANDQVVIDSRTAKGYFYKGKSYNAGGTGFWWSSTRYDEDNRFAYSLIWDGGLSQYHVGAENIEKIRGMTIRCILNIHN